MTFRAAFYKGTSPGLAGVYNRAVCAFENGDFSHCELIFSDGKCASASYRDGGVRFKDAGSIDWANGKWVMVELPPEMEAFARAYFEQHNGLSYDLRGNLRFVLPWGNRDSRGKKFCIEALLEALGVPEAWRMGVNVGYAICLVIAASRLSSRQGRDTANGSRKRAVE